MAHEFPGSDWGDWLPREVESADPDGLSVWYLGCNGFFVKGADGTTLLIDPYLGNGDPGRTMRMIPVPFAPGDVQECDAILSTHEHSDHVHAPTKGPILADTNADYYAPDDSLAVAREENWADEYGFDEDRLVEVAEGDVFEVGGIRVHVEPAHDPDATHPVSYVVEHDGRTFFHGGDARPSDVFADVGGAYDIDLGVVAFGSAGMIADKETREPKYTRWYADENEAAEAANQLQLDRLLPTHWDMWKGLTADPEALRPHVRSFDYPRTMEVLEVGDRTAV